MSNVLHQVSKISWLTELKNAFVNSAPVQAAKRMMMPRIVRHGLLRVPLDIERFRQALESARFPMRPDRRALYAIYREVELDDQVITQTRVARILVQRAPFEIVRNNKADEEAIKLFHRPWFHDLLEAFVATEWWGHSLLEFTPPAKGGELQSFFIVPRDHVRPEYGDVVVTLGETKGIPFRDNKDLPYVFEIGRPDDIGLYHVIAIPASRKRYSDTDWSLFSERFGSPFLAIKTDTRDQTEMQKRADMAASFGSNGWAILDDNDEIQIHESNKQNGHLTFQARMVLADEQIAKLINGQTGSSDTKAYVGSAEVHERLLNDFTFERLTRAQYLINFKLIPFLVSIAPEVYGSLTDTQFEFTELRKKEKGTDELNASQSFAGAQRLNLAAFNDFYPNEHQHCC